MGCVNLNIIEKTALLIAIILGIAGGVFAQLYLQLLSYLITIVTLSLSENIKKHQMVFLFPIIFVSSLAFNVRIALYSSSLSLPLYGFKAFSLLFVFFQWSV